MQRAEFRHQELQISIADAEHVSRWGSDLGPMASPIGLSARHGHAGDGLCPHDRRQRTGLWSHSTHVGRLILAGPALIVRLRTAVSHNFLISGTCRVAAADRSRGF
jgi:hypothetical protein